MPAVTLRTRRTMLRAAGLTREDRLRSLVKEADQSTDSVTQVDVGDLTVRVGANQILHFHGWLICSAAATTTGIQLGINGPAGGVQVDGTIIGWTDVTTRATDGVSAYETFQANLSSPGTTRRIFEIVGRIINGPTRGTVALRVRSEVAGSAVTVHQGSWLEIFLETQRSQKEA